MVQHACPSSRLVLAQTLVIHYWASYELSHGGCFTAEKAKSHSRKHALCKRLGLMPPICSSAW